MPQAEQVQNDLIRDRLAPGAHQAERPPVGALQLELPDVRPKGRMIAHKEPGLVHAITSYGGMATISSPGGPVHPGTTLFGHGRIGG